MADPRAWLEKGPWIQVVAVENSAPTLISGKGGKWLIDPGSKRAWAYTVRPFLHWHGVNALKGVILTAGISDRLGAASELVRAMQVDWWAETGTSMRSPALKSWLAELEKRKEGKQFWRAGEGAPPAGLWQGEDPLSLSLMTRRSRSPLRPARWRRAQRTA